MVTTNFPIRVRGDVTGNFVYDPVVELSDEVAFTVLAPLDPRHAARHEPLGRGVEVYRFQYFWPRAAQRLAYGYGIPDNLATSRLAWFQLPMLCLQLLRWTLRLARRVDVIHCHWLLTVPFVLPAARRYCRPIVVTLHGTDVNRSPAWLTRRLLRCCDLVVSSHDDLLDAVRRLVPEVETRRLRHLIQPQPLSADAEAQVRRHLGEGPKVVFVGRLSPVRDAMTLVRAAPHVLAEAPRVRFALLGEGPQRRALEKEIARLGLTGRVLLFGHRPDVWTFLHHADVFTALSPVNNVWVTALAEAMAAGVPAVVTASGVTADTLTDGHDALLIPPGDERALARAIVRLLRDQDLASRLAGGARTTLAAAGFEPDRVRQETLAAYRDAVGQRTGR